MVVGDLSRKEVPMLGVHGTLFKRTYGGLVLNIYNLSGFFKWRIT